MTGLPGFCYHPRIHLIWALVGIPFLIFVSTATTQYIIEPDRQWAITTAVVRLLHYVAMLVMPRLPGGRNSLATPAVQGFGLVDCVMVSAVYVADNKQYPYLLPPTLMFLFCALCDVAAFMLATHSSEKPDFALEFDVEEAADVK